MLPAEAPFAAVWPAITIGRTEPLRLLQAGRGTM